MGPPGNVLFTGADIRRGQEVFLQRGLMENGTLWGHGAYLGPDFSAQYLHALVTDTLDALAQERFGKPSVSLSASERESLKPSVRDLLKQNRFDPASQTLTFTAAEASSFDRQVSAWGDYFAKTTVNRGLPARYLTDAAELRPLTAFFAWAAWASVANRLGKTTLIRTTSRTTRTQETPQRRPSTCGAPSA